MQPRAISIRLEERPPGTSTKPTTREENSVSEQEAGGSVDRDEERDVPTADEVLTSENGVDEAAEKAKHGDDAKH
jgi:hypothetical protein